MSTNPLNDISRLYLNQIAVSETKEKPTRWWDNDGDDIGYEKGEVSSKFKRKKKKVDEAKSNDGNLANNYPPYDKVTRGDVISGALGKDQMGGKKKKVNKEGFSNWREDLIEVVDKIKKNKDEEKITEKTVKNKIKINPNIGEAVESLGGTLLEMNEIEDFEGVLDELSESEIFLLSDQLIEEVVEEFFYECLEEGYDLGEVENTLLESLEISSALLNEAKVTYGHDTDVKSNRLEKVKTAVKNTGKKLVRGAGYVAGLAVRGAKAVGRELSVGYKRGKGGASGSSSSSEPSRSSTSSSSSSSGSSKPGLLRRIGSALKSGLKKVVAKGARKVARGAIGVARRMEKEKPSAVHSKTGVRSASPRSGIGGGKRVEVAGEPKKEEPVKKVSVKDVTKKKAEKSADPWEGTATTPPKAKSQPKAKAKTTKVSSGTASTTPKRKRKSKLDDLLASVRNENIHFGEQSFDINAAGHRQQQRIEKATKLQQATKGAESSAAGSAVKRLGGSGISLPLANSYEPSGRQLQEKPGDGYLGPTPIPNPIRLAKDTVDATNRASQRKVDAINSVLPGSASMPKNVTYFNKGPSAASQKYLGLKNSYEPEGNQIDEKTLTAAETKEKERIVKSMKDKAADFEKRYPGRGKEVMFATATKIAKKIAK